MTKTLIWDASEGATGYKVYDNQVLVVTVTTADSGPMSFARGPHVISVTALAGELESEPSETFAFIVPKKPGKPRFK